MAKREFNFTVEVLPQELEITVNEDFEIIAETFPKELIDELEMSEDYDFKRLYFKFYARSADGDEFRISWVVRKGYLEGYDDVSGLVHELVCEAVHEAHGSEPDMRALIEAQYKPDGELARASIQRIMDSFRSLEAAKAQGTKAEEPRSSVFWS